MITTGSLRLSSWSTKIDLCNSCIKYAAACFRGGEINEGLSNFRKANREASEAVGNDHVLCKTLTTAITLLELFVPKNNVDLNVKALEKGPVTQFTEQGFEVFFVLPRGWNKTQLISHLVDIALKAEKEWDKHTASSGFGEYNNSFSEYSLKNTFAKQTVKLFDPDGKYRGRINKNSFADDSIFNSFRDFGSSSSESSIFYLYPSRAPENWFDRPWKIVADKS